MSLSMPPVPPEATTEINKQLAMLVKAQRGAEVATLTAAIVASMDRHVSIEKVLEIRKDIYNSLYTDLSTREVYNEWAKTKDSRISAIQE